MFEILFFLVSVLTVLSWGLSAAQADVQDIFAVTTKQEVYEYEEVDTGADDGVAGRLDP